MPACNQATAANVFETLDQCAQRYGLRWENETKKNEALDQFQTFHYDSGYRSASNIIIMAQCIESSSHYVLVTADEYRHQE